MEIKILSEVGGATFQDKLREAYSEGWRPINGGFSTTAIEQTARQAIAYGVILKRTWYTILVTRLSGVMKKKKV